MMRRILRQSSYWQCSVQLVGLQLTAREMVGFWRLWEMREVARDWPREECKDCHCWTVQGAEDLQKMRMPHQREPRREQPRGCPALPVAFIVPSGEIESVSKETNAALSGYSNEILFASMYRGNGGSCLQ